MSGDLWETFAGLGHGALIPVSCLPALRAGYKRLGRLDSQLWTHACLPSTTAEEPLCNIHITERVQELR